MPIRTQNPRQTLHGTIPRPISEPKRGIDLRWYIVMVKSRQERALADDLRAAGIAYFLPLHRTMVRGSHRRIAGKKPLFPGYMFFYGDPFAPGEVRKTRRASSIITVPFSSQPLLHAELQSLFFALKEANKTKQKVDPFAAFSPTTIQDAVPLQARVLTGSLKGHIAPVLSLDRKRTLVLLSVTVLGQTVAVEFHPDQLEPV